MKEQNPRQPYSEEEREAVDHNPDNSNGVWGQRAIRSAEEVRPDATEPNVLVLIVPDKLGMKEAIQEGETDQILTFNVVVDICGYL
jgi:hypothetical protein